MISKCIDPKNKVVDSKDSKDHTCMFYAIYNFFRAEKEKFAFSDGNLTEHRIPSSIYLSMRKLTRNSER
jgi:hypothetical protein